jgi:RNA polymerase sigma-70 factor (ECF subfamily)
MRVLFARHHLRIYHYVARFTGDASLAEDAVSDVFLDVWRRSGKFEGRSQVSTWLLAIARYKALTAMRRRADLQLDEEVAAAVIDETIDIEAGLLEKDRSRIIRRCLSRLSPVHREIIDLVYYHEKSIEEVAQIVRVPTGTVKTRMLYARRRLLKLLRAAGVRALPA